MSARRAGGRPRGARRGTRRSLSAPDRRDPGARRARAGRTRHAARLGERDPLAERSVEIELRRLGLHLRQLVHELDPLPADPKEAEKARARIRDGERRQERSEREGGKREHETPPRTPAGGGSVECSEHARHEIRRGRHVELAAEGQECPLELAHDPTSARRRSSARAVRDFTVPSLTPSTSAVSCSLSSRK